MEQDMVKANVIYYTTKFEILQEVVRKTDEIKNNDLLKSEFIARLGIYVTNKSGMVLVSFGENKKLNSCMVLSRHIDKFGEYLWVDFAYIDKNSQHLREKYREEIMETCKLRGIRRIQMRMSKGYKAMGKLFNAHEIAKILEIEVV